MKQNAYKLFFWILMGAVITGIGSATYMLITLHADVGHMANDISAFKTSFQGRLAQVQKDNKALMYWKGFMEGRNGTK